MPARIQRLFSRKVVVSNPKTLRGAIGSIEPMNTRPDHVIVHSADNDLCSKEAEVCADEVDELLLECRACFGDRVGIYISGALPKVMSSALKSSTYNRRAQDFKNLVRSRRNVTSIPHPSLSIVDFRCYSDEWQRNGRGTNLNGRETSPFRWTPSEWQRNLAIQMDSV